MMCRLGGWGVKPYMAQSHISACHDVCLCEQMKNEAEARRQQYILEGEGEAQAIRLRAQVLWRQTVQRPISHGLGHFHTWIGSDEI